MANLFGQNNGAPQTQRQLLERNYTVARMNLLFALAFTLLNFV